MKCGEKKTVVDFRVEHNPFWGPSCCEVPTFGLGMIYYRIPAVEKDPPYGWTGPTLGLNRVHFRPPRCRGVYVTLVFITVVLPVYFLQQLIPQNGASVVAENVCKYGGCPKYNDVCFNSLALTRTFIFLSKPNLQIFAVLCYPIQKIKVFQYFF